MCNFLDPLCSVPAPTVISDGKALPHTSLVSTDFVVGPGFTTVLLATNAGDTGMVALLFDIDPAGEIVNESLQTLVIPTLAASATDGGPTAMRSMKLSVNVTNCSNALRRGGRVTYLNSSQRLAAQSVSNTNYSAVVKSIKSAPARRRITGDDLRVAKHLIAFPVDNVNYNTFRENRGPNVSFVDYLLTPRTAGSSRPRGMSIIAYVFDPVAETQDYSVTIRAAFYTRWPLTSVPGQSMRPIPTAPAEVLNHVHDHAENTANDLLHVGEGAAAVSIGPRIASALRSAGSAIYRRVAAPAARAAGEAFEEFAGFALPAAEEAGPMMLAL